MALGLRERKPVLLARTPDRQPPHCGKRKNTGTQQKQRTRLKVPRPMSYWSPNKRL